MAETTKIQWCDHTFNPWRGCTKVSPGCARCYADTQAKRNPGTLGVWGPNGTRVVASEAMWHEPEKWNAEAGKAGTRRKVFCASMADVFEDWGGPVVSSKGNPLWWCHGSLSNSPLPSTGLPEGCRMATLGDIRERLFDLIGDTPHLDWLLLTKRPENIERMWPADWRPSRGTINMAPALFSNVWLGVSVEDQQRANERIPLLLGTPAAVRFLSVEPLLESVDLDLAPSLIPAGMSVSSRQCWPLDNADGPRIGWVIAGGESGHNARPCNIAWLRSIVQQCKAAHVACFVKQLGANVEAYDVIDAADYFPGTVELRDAQRPNARVILSDSKGGDIKEFPKDLQIREFPQER